MTKIAFKFEWSPLFPIVQSLMTNKIVQILLKKIILLPQNFARKRKLKIRLEFKEDDEVVLALISRT